MTDYAIAINTHRRSSSISKNVLGYLNSTNVDPARIYLFVTPGQEDEYRDVLPPTIYGHIVTGAFGYINNRNSIPAYFPAGQPVVQMDDDVQALQRLSGSRLTKVADAHALFTQAFDRLAQTPATLWGTYPVANAYFMRNEISLGLHFCIATCQGYLNRPEEILHGPEKDDYERTLLRYETDGCVMRLNMITAKAGSIRKNSGGLQDIDRLESNSESVNYLINRWPAFVRHKKPRPDGYAEIRLATP